MPNKPSDYIIALVYLSYFLFYPFFHDHYELADGGTKLGFHSHIFNNSLPSKNNDECHHSLNSENDHDHPILSQTKYHLQCSRLVSAFKIINVSIILNIEPKQEIVRPHQVDLFPLGESIKEKTIHSSGNTSPPFAFIAV
ncbi:MAG: hypothetical protein HY964_08105 [Ignavibacteriales bacterium]|nr:hypothetical protein [Ignavibacteriales bacterium]